MNTNITYNIYTVIPYHLINVVIVHILPIILYLYNLGHKDIDEL